MIRRRDRGALTDGLLSWPPPSAMRRRLTASTLPEFAIFVTAELSASLQPLPAPLLATLEAIFISASLQPLSAPLLAALETVVGTSALQPSLTAALIVGGPTHATAALQPSRIPAFSAHEPAGGTPLLRPTRSSTFAALNPHPSIQPTLTPRPVGLWGHVNNNKRSAAPTPAPTLARGARPYFAPALGPAAARALTVGGRPYVGATLAPARTVALKVTQRSTFHATADTWTTYNRDENQFESCPLLDLNNDDTNLTVARRAGAGSSHDHDDTFLKFNLQAPATGAALPAGLTVVRAALRLTPTNSQPGTISTGTLADAGEGWTETGLICATRPTVTFDGSFTQPAGTVAFTADLPAAVRARVTARHASTVSLVLSQRSSNSNSNFEDLEGGTSVAPMLTVDYWNAGDP